MVPYGLPTFPIADGMIVGKWSQPEYDWLFAHGWVQTVWAGRVYRYRKERETCRVTVIPYQQHASKQVDEKPHETIPFEAFLQKEFLAENGRWLHHWTWYGNQEEGPPE